MVMVKIGCLFAVTKCNFFTWTVFAEPIYREPQTSFNMHWMIHFNHIFFRRGGSCGRDYLGTWVVLENYMADHRIGINSNGHYASWWRGSYLQSVNNIICSINHTRVMLPWIYVVLNASSFSWKSNNWKFNGNHLHVLLRLTSGAVMAGERYTFNASSRMSIPEWYY